MNPWIRVLCMVVFGGAVAYACKVKGLSPGLTLVMAAGTTLVARIGVAITVDPEDMHG